MKGRYQITLNKKIVDEVKEIQKRLSGGENLSGLLNALMERWYIQNKTHLKICFACGKPTPGKS